MTYPTFSLQGPSKNLLKAQIAITGSKSETNRLLLLQALFPVLSIDNLSNSEDAQAMQRGVASSKGTVDIYHAGTAMRFLVGYFASKQNSEVILTGSERMQQRPIGILVEALRDLGADISYEENEGYPPVRIKGKAITKNNVQINGNVSSQYISSLILMGTHLAKGVTIELMGKITSIPYINMTLSLLNQLGISTHFEGNIIQVLPAKQLQKQTVVVESDWSSASYFYAVAAFSEVGSEIQLSAYKKESLQGDSCLAEIYTHFGVETVFDQNTITLKKVSASEAGLLTLDLKNAPDIAQTIAVTCFGLGVTCHLTGLHTLKIKETDRLEALEAELKKLGASISITNESLSLSTSEVMHENIAIKTYNDHRMAMAFAPLAFKVPIAILDAEVVSKSYQKFWKDMQQIGIQIKEL